MVAIIVPANIRSWRRYLQLSVKIARQKCFEIDHKRFLWWSRKARLDNNSIHCSYSCCHPYLCANSWTTGIQASGKMLQTLEVPSVWSWWMCWRRHGLRCLLLLQFRRSSRTRTAHYQPHRVKWLPRLLPWTRFPSWVSYNRQHLSINWTQQTHGVLHFEQFPEKVFFQKRLLGLIFIHKN